MAKLSAKDYRTRDIYVYWSFEDAMVRYAHEREEFFVKLMNGKPEFQRPHHNKLVTDVHLYGVEITKEEYDTGVIEHPNGI